MKKLITLLIGIFLFGGISIGATGDQQKQGMNYKSTIIYLGQEDETLNLGFQQNFDKQRTQFQEIFLSDKKAFSEEEILGKINENIADIKKSEIIIINTNNFDVFFQLLNKANDTENLELDSKSIYLITNTNKFFLKRIAAKYIKLIGVEDIYTLPQDELLNFLSSLSLGKINNQEEYITNISLTFQETPKFYLISYFIDNLISNGFPIDLIAILLILSVGTLVVSTFRQIIGFSVFGVYSPLLFALSIAVLGIPTSLGLLILGYIAKFVTNFFCKKIYLLHNAKTTLLILLYILLIISAIGLDSIFKTHIVPLEIFTTTFSLFPIIFIIIVTDKVFNEGFSPFSGGRRISFGEFLIVSFTVRGLINRSFLKHLLLSYPELLIVVFLLNILIGRFTGLQLLEYLRFMPLIKKHLDGEEE